MNVGSTKYVDELKLVNVLEFCCALLIKTSFGKFHPNRLSFFLVICRDFSK